MYFAATPDKHTQPATVKKDPTETTSRILRKRTTESSKTFEITIDLATPDPSKKRELKADAKMSETLRKLVSEL